MTTDREKQLEDQKNDAYSQRNKLLALLCALTRYECVLGKHVGEEWEEDWRNIVFIQLPVGQISFHIHDSELPLFAGLRKDPYIKWDGHSDGEKWKRIQFYTENAYVRK